MHRDLNFDEESNEAIDQKNKGNSVFKVGVFLCITGMILLISGMSSVSLFQINSHTESTVVMPIVCCIGVALIFITLGNNCMIHEGKTWLFSSGIGLVFTFLSMVLFVWSFENNWFYPLISFILFLYVIGFILLMGNTLWVLPLSLFSSFINTSGFHKKEKIFKEVKSSYMRGGIVRPKLSFLDVIDEIQSYHLPSMNDLALEAELESYPDLSVEDDLISKTDFQLDDSFRRRLEVYQLMYEK